MFYAAGTTPSTLTPTYEMNSPQVSRKNSLVGTTCRSGNNAIQEESVQQQRETVIRFQLENEVTHPAKAELIKSDLVPSASAHQDNVPGEIDVNMDGSYSEGGTNKLGQLYFKVRYGAWVFPRTGLFLLNRCIYIHSVGG